MQVWSQVDAITDASTVHINDGYTLKLRLTRRLVVMAGHFYRPDEIKDGHKPLWLIKMALMVLLIELSATCQVCRKRNSP